MEKLNLPLFEVNIRTIDNKTEIFDEFRKKFLVLSPEEWVRQHFAHFMVNHKDYPKGLIALEYSLKLQSRSKRVDILAFSPQGNPLVVVECKSTDVKISQQVFDQIARYNMALRVEYLVVTNGIEHYACKINYNSMTYKYIEEIPSYKQLT